MQVFDYISTMQQRNDQPMLKEVFYCLAFSEKENGIIIKSGLSNE